MLEASLKHCMSPSSSWRTDLWQMMNSGVVGFLKISRHNYLIKMSSGNSQNLTNFFPAFLNSRNFVDRFLMILCLFWKDVELSVLKSCYWRSEQMGLVGFQVNLPQRNAELFGIFDFRSVVRCGKPMGGRKSENILIETVRTRETFCLTWRG